MRWSMTFVWLMCLAFSLMVMFSSASKPTSLSKIKHEELFFWKPNSWTWTNFKHWEWTINVQKVIDTPIDGVTFWIRWLYSPRYIPQDELWNYTIVYWQLLFDNLMLYEKGVAMQIQGLWLQHKYDQALKRILEHMFPFF
jgi:hypothetical protein